ncbi:MAG: peptide deformylase [Actinobacteria bacterium]|nr:peptide deformylase [Actinomycetota bacterium]
MAVRKIRKIGDPILREKSIEIKTIDKNILNLAKDMIDTITRGEEEGVGLAAPQIGVAKRLIVVNFEDSIKTLINPEIEVLDGTEIEGEEGCLSLYSIKCNIKRPRKVRVKAIDLEGQSVDIEASDILARIFMHEVDHLNGVLLIDHLDKKARIELLNKINEISS